MHIIASIINIVAIVVLLLGLFYNFKQPKHKAVYGYSVAGSMLAYIVVIILVAICEVIAKSYLSCLVLLLCAISPFAIGKLVKYGSVKKYTVIQILCYVVSLGILLFKF